MCESCGNRIGFVFGVCIDCGWNHITKQYFSINVVVDELRPEDRFYLVEKHAALCAQAGNETGKRSPTSGDKFEIILARASVGHWEVAGKARAF